MLTAGALSRPHPHPVGLGLAKMEGVVLPRMNLKTGMEGVRGEGILRLWMECKDIGACSHMCRRGRAHMCMGVKPPSTPSTPSTGEKQPVGIADLIGCGRACAAHRFGGIMEGRCIRPVIKGDL